MLIQSDDSSHESNTLCEPENSTEQSHPNEEEGEEQEEYIDHHHSIDTSQALLAYIFFFILGSSFLLPWNSLLVSTTYFGSRLIGHQFQFNYMNWITVVFTISNVIFISRATSTQQNIKHPTFRIIISLLLITTTSIILLISTRYIQFNPNWFFGFLITVTLSEALGSAYLQTSVIGLSAWFGSNYLQAILSGQGAIGVLVSIVQLIVNIKELDSSSSDPSRPIEDIPAHIRQSSFTFFSLCTGFSIFALICFLILLRLPIYKSAIQRQHTARDKLNYQESDQRPLLPPSTEPVDSRSTDPPGSGVANLRVVERKIRSLGLSIFYNFFITLAVFPSITGFILSSNDPDRTHIGSLTINSSSNGSRFIDNWYKPIIFIPLHFVIFNLGDWLGRVLPQLLPRLSQSLTKSKKVLYSLSLSRTIFIPLFLICNIDYSSIVLFRSDLIYLIILVSFSISNGYLSTLIMTAGVLEPTLKPNEVDVAATCLSFYLTSGLAAGSLISFGVKAIVYIL
ncbi:hypothetical protein MJO28_014792 [Puccinia striiformis f. sp. tritici]|uniref:Uncharacterized protein n=1 Tax=Puccinia striiformis f. sp. tritici TaxID=168172 RepID=A0ACC0DUM7_9BASI|nr:hypothetical protein Pst134EB_027673 [Puccinia striiformis f. sp. tritici]KAI7939213.1 hypothetical protein MJO28_014792 [Puccinia striiformis f. sp. tritici]